MSSLSTYYPKSKTGKNTASPIGKRKSPGLAQQVAPSTQEMSNNEEEEGEAILRHFDSDIRFGPCVGISRT